MSSNRERGFSSFCVRQPTTIKTINLSFLDPLRQKKNGGLGENFRMKNKYMSANLRAFSYAVTCDSRDRGLAQVIRDIISDDPDSKVFNKTVILIYYFLQSVLKQQSCALNCRLSIRWI